jgi:hypothetical protein
MHASGQDEDQSVKQDAVKTQSSAQSKQNKHCAKSTLNLDQCTKDGRRRAEYIVVFDNNESRIYDVTTTIVSASKDPLLVASRFQDTGLWKLHLDYEVLGREYPKQFIAGVDKVNAIFNLPNTQKSLLYHHALEGFPPKEMFLAVVRA